MLYDPSWEKKTTERQRVLKFIAALRSGEYKQCFGRLQRGNERCAMGVWYELLDDPTEVTLEIAGIPFWHITKMNDWDRASFAEIADYIEKRI